MSELPAANPGDTPLTSYSYSYPHKSSYRPLTPPVALRDVWRNEDQSRLFLYLHVPFCEMRCGFCNLFTSSQPKDNFVEQYLQTLHRQMQVVRSRLPAAQFVQVAVGGGTPTLLDADQLRALFSQTEGTFDCSVEDTPTSVETSPETADADRLRVLADFGVERISLGVQSFDDTEVGLIGRSQRSTQVHAALERIRQLPFRVLNIDLIYGHPDQPLRTWDRSLKQALRYRPEELFLYPLYVRPRTGLARRSHCHVAHRVDLYRHARSVLIAAGYQQKSMRCFRLAASQRLSPNQYACQVDGMIGLGCGARSYTRELHYSTRFAVTQAGIRAILGQWVEQSDHQLAFATHGVRLDCEEQRRRFVILSLLDSDGLSRRHYRDRFGTEPLDDFHELARFADRGWIAMPGNELLLTADGLENSDLIGPALYSQDVLTRLEEFVTK